MTRLNPHQLEAVRSIARPTLVLAGAGSGKTSVITRKIAYLIHECGFAADRVAAVTFTNKAAREMKERVGSLVSREEAEGLIVSTFHNLGLRILRGEMALAGLRPGFSIFDAEDSRTLLREICIQQGSADSALAELFQGAISRLKNELVSPDEALQRAENRQEQTAARIYQGYQQALSTYNAVDFDDLITRPVQLLRSNEAMLARWRSRIHYLLVDEYQDTNMSQYELVRLLVGDRTGLTVVGDDDQSIYTWRGARPENLLQLQEDYPSLHVIKLEQNYRSTPVILNAANTLIANNPHLFLKKLWSEIDTGNPIRVFRATDDKAEAERVVQEILAHRLRYHLPFRDFAILYRGNHQARVVEVALQQERLPYRISGGTSFFSRTEVKDIMAYLRLVANPSDDNALLRIINVPRRKIGTNTIEALSQHAQRLRRSLFEAMGDPHLATELGSSAAARLADFRQKMVQLQAQSSGKDPVAPIRKLVEEIGYSTWLHQNSSTPQVAEHRLQNVFYLIESLQHTLEREQQENPLAGIQEAINRLILSDMLEKQEEAEENAIQLLTLHASKGLEFRNVFIIGMEEELLPHRTSIEEENVEEERRLAYVGITRARESLTLSYAARRKLFGEMVDTTHSRFLDELPTACLHWEGHASTPIDSGQPTATEVFAGLRKLLKS
jgi:ATP-dependent DNA helicase Rep